jgi:hypothetical protein
MNANVINADAYLESWAKTGSNKAKLKPQFVHDVDAVGDIIRDLTDWEKEIVLSEDSKEMFKSIFPSKIIKRKGPSATYASLFSHVIAMVEFKFGSTAVDVTDGWRAFAARGEVIKYARQVTKITIDMLIAKGFNNPTA